MPYIEQEAAYRERFFAVAVPVYICPSRGRPNPQTVPAADPVFDFWIYDSGGVNPWGKTDYAASLQISLGSYSSTTQTGKVLSVAEITDGTTNTIRAGEKSMDLRAYDTGGWLWDEPIFAGGAAGGTVRSGAVVQRDAIGADFPDSWGSAHLSGANFLFGDGSVRLIRFGVSQSVMRALLSPAGGEPAPNPDD